MTDNYFKARVSTEGLSTVGRRAALLAAIFPFDSNSPADRTVAYVSAMKHGGGAIPSVWRFTAGCDELPLIGEPT